MDYKSAGVDIKKADKLIGKIRDKARLTYDENVLSGIGGFGALYELKDYKNPILVPATDGVGTKILLAQSLDHFAGLGFDLVAMCVDDVICTGAKPLFFIDYIAVGKLNEYTYTTILESIANACAYTGCSLIGGETAELPGMYADDEFDLAGFCVGVVEKDEIIKAENVNKGDVVIGLHSDGFRSNGFSLIRRIIEDKKLDLYKNYGFGNLGEKLLTPARIYAPIVLNTIKKFDGSIKGIAHITGGGIPGNLNRILPNTLDAVVHKNSWKVNPMIDFIINKGELDIDEAYKVFNMGIGMCLIVSADTKNKILNYFNTLGYPAMEIGEIVDGSGVVQLID